MKANLIYHKSKMAPWQGIDEKSPWEVWLPKDFCMSDLNGFHLAVVFVSFGKI